MVKMVQSGPIVEVYHDSRPFSSASCRRRSRRCPHGSMWKKPPAPNRRKILRRLISANYEYGKTLFVTLTFNTSCAIFKAFAESEYRLFARRLSYWFPGIRIIRVAERQPKSKRWHYHLLVFGMERIENAVISAIWGNGFTKTVGVFRNELHVANYMGKYLSKDSSFRCSSTRNCLRPVIVKGDIAIGLLEKNPGVLSGDCVFEYYDYGKKFFYGIYRISCPHRIVPWFTIPVPDVYEWSPKFVDID